MRHTTTPVKFQKKIQSTATTRNSLTSLRP